MSFETPLTQDNIYIPEHILSIITSYGDDFLRALLLRVHNDPTTPKLDVFLEELNNSPLYLYIQAFIDQFEFNLIIVHLYFTEFSYICNFFEHMALENLHHDKYSFTHNPDWKEFEERYFKILLSTGNYRSLAFSMYGITCRRILKLRPSNH